MVCDYYIERFLEVEYKIILTDTKTSEKKEYIGMSKYEYSFKKAWFPDFEYREYESDDDPEHNEEYFKEYENIENQIKKICLMPIDPVVIFVDGKFMNPKIEEKYLPFIKKKIINAENKKTEDKIDLKDIIKMTKKEMKYEQHRYFEIHPENKPSNWK